MADLETGTGDPAGTGDRSWAPVAGTSFASPSATQGDALPAVSSLPAAPWDAGPPLTTTGLGPASTSYAGTTAMAPMRPTLSAQRLTTSLQPTAGHDAARDARGPQPVPMRADGMASTAPGSLQRAAVRPSGPVPGASPGGTPAWQDGS